MNSFVATLQQLGPARLGVMGAILLGLLMFFVFLSMRISTAELKLLYTDLSSTDSGAIAAKLEETDIAYQISADGSRILVPGDQVGRARMLLAEAGLPNGGSLGYEIFDQQSGFGTTNFVQNINQVRALEGELARTISSLDGIRSARVHIVLPQRELFSREQRVSSASVFLGIRGNVNPAREQIAAIQSLVSSAVPNLSANDVSVIDSNGNLLAKGGSDDDDLLSLQTEGLKRNYEARLQSKIESQVSRIVGFGKVTAIVTANMNFDRVSMNEELYNPEGQVLRSTQSSQENSSEREPAGSDVSVGNNLPGAGGDLLGDSGPSAESNRNETTENYEISKTVRNIVRQTGDVERLSVSVLVDGRYITTEDEEGNEVRTYEQRPQEELDQIAALVRNAIGFDEQRGDTLEIANLQFAQVDVADELVDDSMLLGFNKSDLIDAAEIVVVAIMIILVVLLVLQPMVSKLINVEIPTRANLDETLQHDLLASSPSNPALAPPQQMGADGQPLLSGGNAYEEPAEEDTLINIQGIEGKVKASTVKKVEEIVDGYPEETVAVLRSWMAEES